ncbi:uncharacterized protein L201_002018 [Kwoniella dendrophila CBS 6074]|uniref:Uncharacterized protein n=1 Tax=Kwoniella dendrophila CBS 6074 TaxID=1295534 RepID=A0AAX4JQZ9_9TREE
MSSKQTGSSTSIVPPNSASSQSQFVPQEQQITAKPVNENDSALIFRPEPDFQGKQQQKQQHQQIDVSPTCSTVPKVLEPLIIPQPTSLLPIEPSSYSPSSANINTPATSSTIVSPIPNASGSGRRGPLAIWKSDSSQPKINGKLTSTMNINMRPSSSGSRKGKEAVEMSSLPTMDNSASTSTANAIEDKSKEDMAMAKWRKWVVEQPIQMEPTDHSPLRSRRTSPASTFAGGLNPAVSPHLSMLSSPKQFHTTGSPLEPVGSAGSSSSSVINPRTSGGFSPTSKLNRFDSGSASGEYNEIFNTESVMALRDVELAIDEEVLERNERSRGTGLIQQNRRMSTQPRISELPNPFVDIAQRLSSRRVRPIVLELIQALGHYLDAVWCITYPNRPCPWIIGINESPIPPSIRRMTMAQSQNQNQQTESSLAADQQNWKSPMITAVQQGKQSGHVDIPPTIKDVEFWGDEVTFAIRDVDEVVGIYKGVGWAFGSAMRDGVYGSVSSDNVLGVKGEGGGMARLLNDLEEAIWGDAQPRPTDLSYDLPIDFDPYAVPDDQELLLAASAAATNGTSVPRRNGGGDSSNNNNNLRTNNTLSDFFGESRITRASSSNTNGDSNSQLPAMEEEIDALPDLIQPYASSSLGEDQDGVSEIDNKSSTDQDQIIKSPNLSRSNIVAPPQTSIPGIDIQIDTEEPLTLEEIGKRRHREWLENQRSGLNAW